MSRRLSNPEWLQFLDDVYVAQLHLPPWGGVVEWNGLNVLVFQGPNEVFLTDVSDRPDILLWPKTYDLWQDVFVYNLPAAVVQTAAEEATQAGTMIGTGLATTAQMIGTTAGQLTAPLLGNLTLPLVVAGLVALVYLKR